MSKLAKELESQMKMVKLKKPIQEYRFHPVRKWRFDFAWPDKMLAVEVEGGIWTGGAHTRGKHFISDCEKYNTATLMGWKVLRFPVNLIQDGSALNTIEEALKL